MLEWTTRRVAMFTKAGAEPTYITLSPREGAAYPQRERITIAEAATIPEAIQEAIADINRGAEAEDRAVTRIKVIIYGPKGSAQLASQVFRIAQGSDEPGTSSSGSAREGEVVATIRELRLANAELLQANVRMTASAHAIAVESIKALGTQQAVVAESLRNEAETRGALIVAENEHKSPMQDLRELLQPFIPLVPMIAARISSSSSS